METNHAIQLLQIAQMLALGFVPSWLNRRRAQHEQFIRQIVHEEIDKLRNEFSTLKINAHA